MNDQIRINDTVRSFDFEMHRDLEGSDACYIEGVVEGFKDLEGCTRYDILVTRVVFKGTERHFDEGARVFPPLNGTPTLLGRITDGVFKIEGEAA